MDIKEFSWDFIIWLSIVWLNIHLHSVLFQRLYQQKVGKCSHTAQQSLKKKAPPKETKTQNEIGIFE